MGKSERGEIAEKQIISEAFEKESPLKIVEFFDSETMSVHIKEDMPALGKKGSPGSWRLEKVSLNTLSKDDVKEMAEEIILKAQSYENSLMEVSRESSSIAQIGRIRIVITKPPFSEAWEITAVKPIKKLVLKDYRLSQKLENRINKQAEGILISGAPGEGKSTFVQALAESYSKESRIIKTIEAPRDLDLPKSITRYSLNNSKPKELHDILLLSRPDYTLFDEMRTTDDFKLFSDLRLSGVGMVGVVHATNPVDAIQRFIGRIELGIIPHVIDTVIFIRGGKVEKVFEISMEVKVPSGLKEADLARPIVVVKDFETGILEFEIYSYGEDTVVVPVKKLEKQEKPGIKVIAAKKIGEELKKHYDNISAEVIDDCTAKVFVPKKDVARIIGKDRQNIKRMEDELGIKLVVEGIEPQEKPLEKKAEEVKFEVGFSEKAILLNVGESFVDKLIDVYVGENFLISAKVGKKGVIKVRVDSDVGKEVFESIKKGKIKLFE